MTSTTITINIDSEVLQELKKLAEAQKIKKGFLGKTITAATKKYIAEMEQEEIRKRALKRLRKGYHMGKILIKNRDELYDRK